jgi:hypothetical protein
MVLPLVSGDERVVCRETLIPNSMYRTRRGKGPRFTKTIFGNLKGHVFLHRYVKTRGPSVQFREIVENDPNLNSLLEMK